MNFAREGLSTIGLFFGVAAAALFLALVARVWPMWLLAFLLTVVAVWCAAFFRDPERSGARGGNLVIAPAMGASSSSPPSTSRASCRVARSASRSS